MKRLCVSLLSFAAVAYAENLPAAVVHRPYHHQLSSAGGAGCPGYQPHFALAGGGLAAGLRLEADGRVHGEPERVESGSAVVRATTPCSEETREWPWMVRGKPMLFVEPAEVELDAETTQAAALVAGSWPGRPYSIATATGDPLPGWLKARPLRGRTPPEGSPYSGDRLTLTADPALAPPGAEVTLLVHTWQGSAPAAIKVRFGAAGGKQR